jgi:hypothetical protein
MSLAAVCGVLVGPASIADAVTKDTGSLGATRCGDVRLDRFLHASRHGDFGAFDINADQTDCRIARRVASRYVRDPRAVETKNWRFANWSCLHAEALINQEVYVVCDGRRGKNLRGAGSVTFRNALPSG